MDRKERCRRALAQGRLPFPKRLQTLDGESWESGVLESARMAHSKGEIPFVTNTSLHPTSGTFTHTRSTLETLYRVALSGFKK